MHGSRKLEVETETELHLPRIVGRRRCSDHSERARTSQRKAGRTHDDVVQNIGGLENQHHAEPLPEGDVLRDRPILDGAIRLLVPPS